MVDVSISSAGAHASAAAADRIPASKSGVKGYLTPDQIADFIEGRATLLELIYDTVAVILAAGSNVTLGVDDVTNTITISAAGGSTPTARSATLNVPYDEGGVLEWEETVAAVGVTSSQKIQAWLAPGSDDDVNNADTLGPCTISAVAGTDSVSFSMAFSEPVAGPVLLQYQVLA